MPKRKTSTPVVDDASTTPLEDLVDDLKGAEEEIKGAAYGAASEAERGTPSGFPSGRGEADARRMAPNVRDDAKRARGGKLEVGEAKRRELIKSSEDGEIDQSVKYLKKASAKVIEKIHKQVEEKRLEKANAFITDMLLSRFADTLGGLGAIESSEELNNDLQKNNLLKRDVEKIVAYATPFLPFLGLISGVLTTGKYIYKHRGDDAAEAEGLP